MCPQSSSPLFEARLKRCPTRVHRSEARRRDAPPATAVQRKVGRVWRCRPSFALRAPLRLSLARHRVASPHPGCRRRPTTAKLPADPMGQAPDDLGRREAGQLAEDRTAAAGRATRARAARVGRAFVDALPARRTKRSICRTTPSGPRAWSHWRERRHGVRRARCAWRARGSGGTGRWRSRWCGRRTWARRARSPGRPPSPAFSSCERGRDARRPVTAPAAPPVARGSVTSNQLTSLPAFRCRAFQTGADANAGDARHRAMSVV